MEIIYQLLINYIHDTDHFDNETYYKIMKAYDEVVLAYQNTGAAPSITRLKTRTLIKFLQLISGS